jgi:hypothetical protein
LALSEPVCAFCGSAKSTRTPSAFLRSTGLTCFACRTSGTSTRKPSNKSMSSAAASPAKTFPTPAGEQASTGNVRVFGASTPDSFANYDPDTSSWRTSQLCLLEDSDAFSGTWPRAGMTRSGTAFRLQPLAPLTGGIGSGLLPTPQATMADKGGRGDLLQVVRGNSSPSGRFKTPTIPTPTAGDSKGAANKTAGRSDPNSKHHAGTTLTDFIRQWPAPTARDHKDTGDLSRVPENGLLPRAVFWATPTSSDGTGGPGNSGRQGGENLRTQAGGSLNPQWVEWLMGFPTGWTDLEASEMLSFPKSRSGLGSESSRGKQNGER